MTANPQVFVRCFEPNSLTCLLEPWLHELGFSIFYGSILIKLYRILSEFQTRKAHRVCFRDKDQIVYLLAIILIVIGYMSAWTALMVDGFYFGRQATGQQPAAAANGTQFTRSGLEQVTLLSGLESGQQRKRFAVESSSAGDDLAEGSPVSPAALVSSQSILIVTERLPEQLKYFVNTINSFSDIFSGLLEVDQSYDESSDSMRRSTRCRKLIWDYVTELSK